MGLTLAGDAGESDRQNLLEGLPPTCNICISLRLVYLYIDSVDPVQSGASHYSKNAIFGFVWLQFGSGTMEGTMSVKERSDYRLDIVFRYNDKVLDHSGTEPADRSPCQHGCASR